MLLVSSDLMSIIKKLSVFGTTTSGTVEHWVIQELNSYPIDH